MNITSGGLGHGLETLYVLKVGSLDVWCEVHTMQTYTGALIMLHEL